MLTSKTPPKPSRPTFAVAARLAELRSQHFGDEGTAAIAKELGIPAQTWRNYEHGVAAPAEVILKVLVLFAIEPQWLLTGEGIKFRS